MGTEGIQLEPVGNANHFVRYGQTGKLIGRVWQEPNGEWWATCYLGEGRTMRNVSGGKYDTKDAAVAAVLAGQGDF